MSALGYCEGDLCNRDGCEGVIEIEKVENRSCHLSAPCWGHENADMCCPDCGWRAADDPLCVREIERIGLGDLPYVQTKPRVLDPTKIDWVAKLHSGCSMIKEGVFPLGTSREEVFAAVKGTFGGHFESFDEKTGRFKYIAYTD